MIKQSLYKFFSVLLALVVLLSTVSFTIEKHYCGDVLVDISVFAKTEKCGMEMPEVDTCEITKKSCCKDEIDLVQGQDELIKTLIDFDVDQQQFIAAFIYSYINLFEGAPKQVIPHKDYSPPNLVKDIHVIDQVFLI